MENENINTINYRLSAIEKTLTELKSVLLDTKLQEKDIKFIKTQIEELEQNQACLKNRIKILEERPLKEGSQKWKLITDSIYKIVITGAITFILIKIGFPV